MSKRERDLIFDFYINKLLNAKAGYYISRNVDTWYAEREKNFFV